jgi:sulfate permease, SulP family
VRHSARRGGAPEAEAALFTSLRGYDAGWLRGDLVAGLTVWAVLVPEALAGVLVFDTLPGLFIGVVVSLLLLYRASRPHVAVLGQVPGMPGQYGDLLRHPENTQTPGVALLRVEGGLFFANADTVRDAVRAHAATPGTRAVVLDAETAPFIDVSAARMLIQLTEDLRRSGVELVIARDVGRVRDVLRRAEGGPAPAYPTVQDAVEALAEPESPGSG